MLIKRRRLLQWGLVLAGTRGALAAADPAQPAADAAPPSAGAMPPMTLRNLHTGETLSVSRDDDGSFGANPMQRIATLLRDFRSGEVHPIDPALLDILRDAAAALGADPVFDVISGFRSPQTNEMLRSRSGGVAVRSLHMEGRAIDVRLGDVRSADLAGRALELARGGVGFYARGDFVHLDTGAVRSWRG